MRARRRDPWAVPAILLGIVALASAIPPCLRSLLPAEIDYNEGWNAARQQLAWTWHALYGRPPDLAVTNYPPLSFHVVGAWAWFGGDVIRAGRLLSLIAIAVIGAVLSLVAWRRTRSRALSACAALGWLAGLELWTPQRIGADDPQLLGMAFEAWAFLLFLHQPHRRRRVVLAACLVTAALFTKHNLLALPLGMTLDLVLRRSWSLLASWLAAGASLAAILLVATLAFDGPLLFQHLLQPRLVLPARAIDVGFTYAAISSPALAAVSIWAWRERHSVTARPLILAWLGALVEIAAFAGGDGVGESILQDAIMMTALVQPMALQHLAERGQGTRAPRARRTATLKLSLLSLPTLLAVQIGSAWSGLATASRQALELARAEALVRNAAGPVACEDLALCFHAGRASSFDPYYVLDQLELGRLRAQVVDAPITGRQLAAVQIGCVDDPATAEHTPIRFSPSFMAALRANYRLVFRGAGHAVYLPR